MPIGIIINSMSAVLGGLVGVFIAKFLPERLIKNLPQIFGLSAILIAVSLMVQVNNLGFAIISLIVGTIIGELINFGDNISLNIRRLLDREGHIDEEKMSLLLTSILLFVFSGTGMFGSLNYGFTGDASILIAKSSLDFFTAVIFGASIGSMLMLVAVPQFILNTILFYLAVVIVPYMDAIHIGDFKAVGGMLTLAAGLKLLDVLKVNGLNLVPGLFVAIIGCMVF